MAQDNKSATVNVTVVDSIPTRRDDIFNIFIFSISILALSSATQHARVRRKVS